jgi:S-adenosylmethionine-diacylglycerol 3-amino-3-carboxypropyl transferase
MGVSLHQLMFRLVHSNQLIYNCSWEDPRIDRQLLNINTASNVVAITSAGCNILDMALDQPERIHAVDINPRQNYLLELKKALICRCPHQDLFQFFGFGSHPNREQVFEGIKTELRPEAKGYWQRNLEMFNPRGVRSSFYWHGTTGLLAWLIWRCAKQLPINLEAISTSLFSAKSLEEQQQNFTFGEPHLWHKWMERFVSSSSAMALVGVPPNQAKIINNTYPGGLSSFIKDKFKHVMTEVSITDNYFWRVYTHGAYTTNCCPNYLKPENQGLLAQQASNIHTHDQSISEFLESNPGMYSHFVLLDHLDWLAYYDPTELLREWNLILANSRPGTKVLFRSAGDGDGLIPKNIRPRLKSDRDSLETLHCLDRVGTYGSVHMLEVA